MLRLVRKIADGGMGSVWVAEHLVLGTMVAVKFMSRQWALVPSASMRFLREAKITAMLESPHVVRVLDCRLTEADEPYLVMELLRGENLEQRVRRQGRLSLQEVVSMVSQTADALSHAHAAGYVHRDIKPENVFLEKGAAMHVKLLDFGVAKPKDKDACLEADHLPAGTAQYMSPEHMFEPAETDERSDLFSLGAVAYFALTGRVPFDADSLEGLYFAIDGGKFERPSAVRPGLPPAVDAWFDKALAHAPEDRFPSTRAMVAALEEACLSGRRSLPANEEVARDASAGAPCEEQLPLSSIPSVIPGVRTKPIPRLPARKAAFAAVIIATAASIFAWHDPGPGVPSANAAPPPAGDANGHP